MAHARESNPRGGEAAGKRWESGEEAPHPRREAERGKLHRSQAGRVALSRDGTIGGGAIVAAGKGAKKDREDARDKDAGTSGDGTDQGKTGLQKRRATSRGLGTAMGNVSNF